MKEQLINFETAKLAKEKGFDWNCNNYTSKRDGNYFSSTTILVGYKNWNEIYETWSIPTQSLLHRWLREIHNIDVVIAPERYKNGVNYLVQAQKFDLTSDPETNLNFCIEGSYWFNDNHEYPTYEDAMEKGLEEALKLIK